MGRICRQVSRQWHALGVLCVCVGVLGVLWVVVLMILIFHQLITLVMLNKLCQKKLGLEVNSF